jgi:hypothetical protein
VTDVPDELTLARNRDRESSRDLVFRRIGVAAVSLVLLAGLLNVFGQRPATTEAAVPAAKLKVYAASRIRGGLYYQARFTIEAREELENATLVLDPGWAEGITINTVEPSPVGEASDDGRLVFELGHIPAGKRHLFFLHLQVNPTNVGHRSQDVDLLDGETLVAHVDRTVTVFP